MVAGSRIRLLSIDDRIVQVYFHLVGTGRDLQNLRLIVVHQRLSYL